MIIYTSNTSTQEAEAEGSRIQGQPGLHSKIVSQKRKKDCFNGLDLTLPSHSFFCELYFNSTITDHTSNNCDLILNNKLSLTITDALQNK